MVSGAVALMLERHTELTPDQVKARLMRTAYKVFPTVSRVEDSGKTYTSHYDIFTVGAGYLDIVAALASVEPIPDNIAAPVAPGDVQHQYVRPCR